MNWVTEDLGAFAVGDAEAPGYGFAINDQKKVVGISRRTYLEGGQQLTNFQAFRTAAETTIWQSSAPLLRVFPEVVDQGSTNYNHTNVARAINVVGDAAGASQVLVKIGDNWVHKCRAAFWRQDSQDPVDLGVLNGGDHSEILGLNSEPYKNGTNWQTFPEYRSFRVQFVGWSNTQPNGAARRAIYGYYYPWKYYWMALYNLNDPNFVQGVGSWTLQEARAINDQGHIVGIGTYQGRTTGFLLVPLSPAP
jgi:hypothetical protein